MDGQIKEKNERILIQKLWQDLVNTITASVTRTDKETDW